jgi:hypothetical protein
MENYSIIGDTWDFLGRFFLFLVGRKTGEHFIIGNQQI